ncbi:hypothetical protein ABAC460_00630 [Asticcacaulis sp. AC460]|uniref:SDR family oxidoreductase n=1 Tax=Asticcacaulis sp. AC460 TaxID=1282360 RepID=UPI0003C3CC6D|nr:SDR family oxidoreductase [Asticcacaulis sp. AC460]ESQ93607.1 hypothetical protein ABAC460_00630 [Asticcacaulis sp. AC460]
MNLHNTSVIVTGGSRGLGLGLVEALAAQGARVTVVARASSDLNAVQQRLGVDVRPADVTAPDVAQRILSEVRPDIVVLNAGLPPPMASIDRMTWEDFTATWDHDVRAGLYWVQAALNLPLKPGSRVLMTSSGAAISGSPMSGGYGGAKRMLWFMARYAQGLAQEKELGLRFQTLVPRQMVGGTGTGDAGSTAYAAKMGMAPEAFLSRFGAPMTPRDFGDMVVAILQDPRYGDGDAFALTRDGGIVKLEGPDV